MKKYSFHVTTFLPIIIVLLWCFCISCIILLRHYIGNYGNSIYLNTTEDKVILKDAVSKTGVSIAIVDTGISNEKLRIYKGILINSLSNINGDYHTSDTSDSHGHGTLVASLLSAFCPEATLVPVRIAQEHNGQYTPYVPESILARGIDYCIDNHIRLINVSYSIEEISPDGPLDTVCRKAAENNIIIVAAYRNAFSKPVYPAAFPSVIGVSIRQDLDHAQIAIVSKKNYDVAAFGGPYQIVTPDKESKTICGTSFATAQVSGMVARMLAIKPHLTLKQVFAYLEKYAVK